MRNNIVKIEQTISIHKNDNSVNVTKHKGLHLEQILLKDISWFKDVIKCKKQ